MLEQKYWKIARMKSIDGEVVGKSVMLEHGETEVCMEAGDWVRAEDA
jgi:hypothetical protein